MCHLSASFVPQQTDLAVCKLRSLRLSVCTEPKIEMNTACVIINCLSRRFLTLIPRVGVQAVNLPPARSIHLSGPGCAESKENSGKGMLSWVIQHLLFVITAADDCIVFVVSKVRLRYLMKNCSLTCNQKVVVSLMSGTLSSWWRLAWCLVLSTYLVIIVCELVF